MNKKQAIIDFKKSYFEALNTYKWSIGEKRVSRLEAWSNYMDLLLKRELITLQQFLDWSNPFNK